MLTSHIKVYDLLAILFEQGMELSDADGTCRALCFEVGQIVVESFSRFTARIITCFHEYLGYLGLVEYAVSNYESGFE